MGSGPWVVEFCDEFDIEFGGLNHAVQDVLLRKLTVLSALGPLAKRPLVDTLSRSRHANMKELRFDADGGVWRVAYAFDPLRHCIILVAGEKQGVSQGRFYANLIRVADERFDRHLERIAGSPRGEPG